MELEQVIVPEIRVARSWVGASRFERLSQLLTDSL